jgi:hypothetical protein
MTPYSNPLDAALALTEMAAEEFPNPGFEADRIADVVRIVFEQDGLEGLSVLVCSLASQNHRSLNALATATGLQVGVLLDVRRKLAAADAPLQPK